MNCKSILIAFAIAIPTLLGAQSVSEGKTYLISNFEEGNHFIRDTGTLTFGLPAANAIWRFVATDNADCFYIQNVETGKYMQSSTPIGSPVVTGDSPVEYHVLRDNSGGDTNGFWGLASTDQSSHDFLSSDTKGLNDNIDGFVSGHAAQRGVNRRSFWRIEEVGDEPCPDNLDNDPDNIYYNPVIERGVPDPTVVRADDGFYYLYATENPTFNVPIYKSPDLVDWTLIGTVFTDDTRPDFVESFDNAPARVWAPSINRCNGKYYLYYSISRWGSEWECGIGVATADRPEGPFTNHGKIFISSDYNTQNSIDPCFFEENGKKYLFWGSFSGIWGAELTDDGLNILPETIQKISGTISEGTYILKKDGFYYLFGSIGSCCAGQNSTYHVMVARSENLFGPYVNKEGELTLDNHFSHFLYRSDYVIGPGHNAEFVQDDAGDWWMMYHGFQAHHEGAGRVGYLDKVHWSENGWPYIRGLQPSRAARKPAISPNSPQ